MLNMIMCIWAMQRLSHGLSDLILLIARELL